MKVTTFFGELKTNVWKWVYYLVLFYFIVSTFLAIMFGIESMTIVTNVYLLPKTDRWVIILLFLMISGIGVMYGIKAITRFMVSLIFIEFLILIFIVFLGFGEHFRWLNVLPIWTTDFYTFAKSSVSDMARYAGVITLLSFLPYMKTDAAILRPTIYALLFVVTTYTTICIVVLGTFGFEQALTLLSPITALVQSTSTRSGIFERLDLFFLGVWVIAYYKIMLIHTWFIVDLMKRTFVKKIGKLYLFFTLSAVFIVTLYTPSFAEHIWMPFNYNQVLYSSIIPICLFLLLIVKKGKGAK
ncbi:MAG: spore germination protein [Bacillaceae bacterium]|nr:spore germination protein [Bacillaceae bacterium]